ncbi:prepilin-type N-terminal cleavage/methylation domain-containing protein [Desulfobotulus sp. H1]|uniref:Prepilin-type N-terminal cleavage/methylation domain-containing protein n=1 Tax=Desulfobotulus pelophilus TaxID=2823377 RepID=A0ABT3N666_9BACT|nr:prepilin-type N-terminal cleavage/methylation domain-containing protein [Desulfobotulus pelophilus]MCW7752953.1 prepilin-type N-terminal cleavage/methylation domain-containing protein [Desulfobotulus pelophilus]
MRTENLLQDSAAGFTLMELMVVMVLIVLIMGLSFPKIRTAMDGDGERRAVDALISMLHATAVEAVEMNRSITLQRHPDKRGFYRVTEDEGSDREWLFPAHMHLSAMRRAGKNVPESMEFTFYPAAYADPVFFWIDGVRGRRTLILHPLQSRVEIREGFLIPAGWDNG